MLVPLVQRELRVAARRPSTYRSRWLFGAGALGLSYWFLLMWPGWKGSATLGQSLFQVLSVIGLSGALLAGVLLGADCVSRERRDGTFHLLTLTHLRPGDVVLGKLAAKAVLPLYSLLAMFPSIVMTVWVGGVSGGEVWRMLLVFANALFFSLAASIFTSSICRRQRIAYANAIFVVLLLGGCLPAILVRGLVAASTPITGWQALSLGPVGSFHLASAADYDRSAAAFWGSIGFAHAAGWLFLVLATLILGWHWRKSSEEWEGRRRDDGSRFGRRSRALWVGNLLDKNPIAWLALRQTMGGQLIWSLPLVLLFISHGFFGARFSAAELFFPLIGVQILFRVWAATDANGFSEGIRGGTFELLLGTPIAPQQIANGLWSGYRHRYFLPLLVLNVAQGLLVIPRMPAGEPELALVILASGFLLFADLYCSFWIALARALLEGGGIRAVISTVLRTAGLPLAWLVLLQMSTPGKLEFLSLAVLGLGVSTASNLFLGLNSKSIVLQYFPSLALRPQGEQAPLVESQWSAMNWETPDVIRRDEGVAANAGDLTRTAGTA